MGCSIFHRELVGHPSRPPACWGEPEKQRYEAPLPLCPPIAGLSNQSNELEAEGFGVWMTEEEGGKQHLQKTDPIKYPRQV